MRGDFDWQASSNGRKYLSASMKFALGGAAVPSLGQIRRVINFSKHVYHSKLHFLLFVNLKLNNAQQRVQMYSSFLACTFLNKDQFSFKITQNPLYIYLYSI